jgi:hypothetical protein
MCAASLGVAIAEKSYGPEHPNIARHLNNLAGLYYTKADTPRPSRFIGVRFVMDEKSYGPDHPNVAWQVTTPRPLPMSTDHNGRE